MSQPTKRLLYITLSLAAAALLGFIALGLWRAAHHTEVAGGGPPGGGPPGGPAGGFPGRGGAGDTVTVAVGKATLADVPVYQQALGTVVANASVTVTSRVDGQLMAVYFSEGQKVKKGQLLAQIDPRAYQATLAQYLGDLAQNQALLKSAKLTLARYSSLYAKQSLAKQDLDTQAAAVGQYEGAVQADQGQIDAARLNLEYARIVSPIDGYVGLRLVDPGNMVHSSDTSGIVTVTQTDPIAVTFSLPQAQLAALLPKVRQGQALPVLALDQLQNQTLAQGQLKFISNEIDTATGSIKLKAEFANPAEALYPNQFVNVKLQTDTLKQAVTIPSAAVQLSSDGSFVYVIKADGSVERRTISTGPSAAERTAVTQGVQAGEQVVTRGIDHLRTGITVKVEAQGEGEPGAGLAP
ncbi:MdtA/MuxA family multidrug efflux RND transporter periplasmic adaptor subunit [Pseudomonas typographi]|uniref:MdtA/MuxA family multidrug efflux RND transporter periplasmic adaptor subunit n=1 Tax=Pseudomonas typographi TaxID=2715964 RepID=A0ABR7Z1H1_9PSED|nr:MdtA/MuxA family multidrug efflux RND transporter periplasmic adaptor subunit [Pseudomonas typographi]MBD1587010.1 MdtA/MuxA family multidrug efflux RND transporter periplasmic adaptor subunit [Pseudomonas typographi]MBD1599249.1 MdtA/MuxA family multidrug efflux RND transporter periplasmic adaptor subunit [Pseudomonas typographi]